MLGIIADSGSTKCEWRLVQENSSRSIFTQGISPYFLSGSQIQQLIVEEVLPETRELPIEEVFYYGTGARAPPTGKW
jgi:hypothetical protein